MLIQVAELKASMVILIHEIASCSMHPCNTPFYAHSTHLASYSFVGYNIKTPSYVDVIVPLSLQIIDNHGLFVLSGCG